MRCVSPTEAMHLFGKSGYRVNADQAWYRLALVLEPAIAAKQTRIGGRPTPNVERLPYFAEAVNRWHPTRKHRLLWIDHFEESFPSVRHLFIAARAGLGDTRSLSEAPGHCFEPFDYDERDQTRIEPLQAGETSILVGLMSLLMAGGWDGWLVADGCHDRIEFWEGNIFFHSTEASRLRDAETLMNEFDCPTGLL